MPDIYKEAASVIKQALNKEKNIRSAVYASRHKNKRRLLKICSETLRHRKFLEQLVKAEELRTLLKHPLMDLHLLYVALYEYIFGNGLKEYGVNTQLKKLIFSRAIFIDRKVKDLQIDYVENNECGTINEALFPRYARINTLKWSAEEARKKLEEEGWNLVVLPENETDFVTMVKTMAKFDVYIDWHIECLLLFAPKTDLHRSWMVQDGYLILQDKASCLPGVLLKPKAGSHVFDVCCAPGMKTTHLAALMNNEGKIWAFDKAKDRVELMKGILSKAGVAIAKSSCQDFLRIDPMSSDFSKVKYALVDPPCTGSGIVKRMDNLVDGPERKDEGRLRSLSNLQAMLLKHALKLPSVKRVVYSTCSIYEEENEQVIDEILNDSVCAEKYKLVNAMPTWEHRGKGNYKCGSRCLRAVPSTDLTNGFFVAVFKRRKKALQEIS